MKNFMSEDFLLDTKIAERLYFDVAQKQPIIDWHCHISPADIEQDRRFDNISQMWLEGDHYKWRAMRLAGIDERYITGDASDREKYDAFVKTLSRCIGNPLYHWTHLELLRCFGVTGAVSEKNSDKIWSETNRIISSPSFSARKIIEKFNVDLLFTTDDPADSLFSHRKLRENKTFHTKVLPAFRPDKALNIDAADFPEYIEKLGAAAGVNIQNFDDLKQALQNRMDFFAALGCRASDHSFTHFPFAEASDDDAGMIFRNTLNGNITCTFDTEKYKTTLLKFLAGEYKSHGWVMELHIGAMRNNNTKMFRNIGPDSGFDSICDGSLAEKLSRFLDCLVVNGKLPRTVFFSLNPKDNMVLGSMAGDFSEKSERRVEFGTAWWFNDNRDGMEAQIKMYANLCVLANFVGMLTDSRSLLSYPRHEYFRRILCNIIGNWVENGEFPDDYETLSSIIECICYKNAKRFFGL